MTAFDQNPIWRRSWCRHAGTIFGQPLALRYDGLDREATYRLRVVYTGDMFQVKIGLKANDAIDVHPPLLKPRDMKPLEFDLPAKLTRDGTLTLTWTADPNRGRTSARERVTRMAGQSTAGTRWLSSSSAMASA